MSRSTMRDSASTVMPRRPRRKAMRPAFMLQPPVQARVFGVLRDGNAEAGGGDQGGAHDVVFEDGLAIVGEADGAGAGEGVRSR